MTMMIGILGFDGDDHNPYGTIWVLTMMIGIWGFDGDDHNPYDIIRMGSDDDDDARNIHGASHSDGPEPWTGTNCASMRHASAFMNAG